VRRSALRAVVGRLLDAAAAAAAAVLRRLGVRFLQIRAPRIGEVGASLGYFVESGAIGWRPRIRGVFLTFPDQLRLSNACYFEYWRRHVGVVTNPYLYRLAFRVSQQSGMLHPTRRVTLPDGEEVHVDRALVASHPRWERAVGQPLLRLDPEHAQRGREALRRHGIGDDDWFVALHAREGAFFAEGDDSPARHRNAPIASYTEAIRRVVDRGGWVVRVGDPTMTPLPPLERVVDYPHTDLHSDWMDVYLAAACRFFLGCSSGLFVVAWSFGRPVALAHWNSLLTRPWASRDLYIPKLWWHEADQRFLRFPEVLTGAFDVRAFTETSHADEFARSGIRLVDNSPDEIAELVDEMFAAEAGEPLDAEDEARQRAFDALCTHYRYGVSARMAASFLRRHADLLQGAAGGVEA
jgi:putative glycosyltransferase (TIGR04372 family)